MEASGLETVVNSIRCARCRELYLGHGYELAGDTPAAVEAYEAYVGDGFFDASLYVLHLPEPVVHERLGVLYEALDDQARALEHYREFVARWAGADPKLQPRVERARERISDLGG